MPVILPLTASFVWSKLPIPFKVSPLASELEKKRILIDIYDGLNLLINLNYPASDPITIDLQPILQSLPSPKRPDLKDISNVLISTPQNQNGVFDVRIITRLSSDPEPGNVTSKKVIAGGWHNLEFSNEAAPNESYIFELNTFFCNKGNQARILSHVPFGRLMDASEHGWISYVQEVNAMTFQKIVYYINYLDGSAGTVTKTFPAGVDLNKTTWHIPLGIDQVGMDPDGKGVRSMDVGVFGGIIGATTLAHYSISYDYRPCYAWLDIHYRNSLGGWDFFRFRNNIEFSSDVERKEYDRKRPDLYGSNNYYDSEFRLKWKATTGYISLQHMIALNDLVNSTDICILFEGKWLPVKCITKTLKLTDTKNGLHSETFEFESAGKLKTIPQQLLQFFNKPPELR